MPPPAVALLMDRTVRVQIGILEGLEDDLGACLDRRARRLVGWGLRAGQLLSAGAGGCTQ